MGPSRGAACDRIPDPRAISRHPRVSACVREVSLRYLEIGVTRDRFGRTASAVIRDALGAYLTTA